MTIQDRIIIWQYKLKYFTLQNEHNKKMLKKMLH